MLNIKATTVHNNAFMVYSSCMLTAGKFRGKCTEQRRLLADGGYAWLTKRNGRSPAVGNLVSSGGRSHVHHSTTYARAPTPLMLFLILLRHVRAKA